MSLHTAGCLVQDAPLIDAAIEFHIEEICLVCLEGTVV